MSRLPPELVKLIGSYWPNNILLNKMVAVCLAYLRETFGAFPITTENRYLNMANQSLFRHQLTRSKFVVQNGSVIFHQNDTEFTSTALLKAFVAELAQYSIVGIALVPEINRAWLEIGSNKFIVPFADANGKIYFSIK